MKICFVFFMVSMLVLQSGCAKQMRGSPDTDAMLVVECRRISTTFNIFLARDKKVYPEPEDCWVEAVGEIKDKTWDSKATRLYGGLFVFSNLRPGTYRMSRIAAKYEIRAPDPAVPGDMGEDRTFYYQFPVSDFPKLTVSLVAGQIKFLGSISLWVKHGESDDGCNVNREDESTHFSLSTFDEYFVLQDVLKATSDSPWTPRLRARLNTYHQ